MVEFDLKINEKQGSAYFPKEVRKEFGLRLKLFPNSCAGIIYPEDMDPQDVLESVKGLMKELKRKIEKKDKNPLNSGQQEHVK